MQKKSPAVSIIIPVYNVENYLAECVDSILGQTFQDIEILLVDDGSSDASGQMADDYAARDKRVKVIHKENGGQSSARNAGMQIARGKYIYFCDADDYISRDAIEILYQIATKNDLDMVLFNADSFLDPGSARDTLSIQKAASYNHYYDRKGIYEEPLPGGIFAAMHKNREHRASVCLQFTNLAYLREKQLQFYEGIIYEDNLYTLKALLLADRAMFIPQTLFHRRVRAGSTMTSPEGIKNFYGYFVVYCEALYFLSCHTFEKQIVKEVEKEITSYKGGASRIWQKLSENERVKFLAQLEQLPMLHRIMFDEVIGNGGFREELYDIRHGYSFRIGRVVTWLPRKIRGGIRCIRQHGVGYTARRVLEHLGIDMGTPDFRRSK